MVHARNLFHLSIALWDAWAAYDDVATGYVVSEKQRADDLDAARLEALSYAAFRVLTGRVGSAVGAALSQACFAAQLRALGFEPLDAELAGDSPRAVGDRVGRAVLAAFALDGANQAADYAAPEGAPIGGAPLTVDLPGTVSDDPSLWQPLVLSRAVSANGIRLGSGVQGYQGAHWGRVTPFALRRPQPDAPYFELGEAPLALGSGAPHPPSIRSAAPLTACARHCAATTFERSSHTGRTAPATRRRQGTGTSSAAPSPTLPASSGACSGRASHSIRSPGTCTSTSR
jgi:hypothetical protein